MTLDEVVELERDAHNSSPMTITDEWLESIKDSKGLTIGQTHLLNRHTGGAPYTGKDITNQVANFLAHCRGYRAIPENVRAFIGR